MAPEYITLAVSENSMKINQSKADLFSFGLTLLKLFFPDECKAKKLDENKWNIDQKCLENFFKEKIKIDDPNYAFLRLLENMLIWNQEFRPDLEWVFWASRVVLENEVRSFILLNY